MAHILSLPETQSKPGTFVQPQIKSPHYIAETAYIIGDVAIAENVSIFPSAIVRGDIEPISVAKNSNLQEHVLLHTSSGSNPCKVGEQVTVGHRAIIHSAEVKDRVIVGMGSIILDNACVPSDCIVGAGSLITQGKTFEEGSLILGSPAKVVRKLTPEEIAYIVKTSKDYIKAGKRMNAAKPV